MTHDLDRYARHRLIDWWDQERLRTARVMVLGAGAIGNAVIELLALTGVGQILIVDFDRVERSNLTRSALFRDGDVGRSKAETAAIRAREINPEIEVQALEVDLEFDLGLGVYRAMDVVIGCLDNVGARLAANRACRRVGRPMLNGGIEATFAEICLYSGLAGPCYECSLPDGLWERLALRFSCTGLRTDVPADAVPTTAVVAAITAGFLVNEALYLLHFESSDQAIGNGVKKSGVTKEGLAFGQKLFLTLKPYGFHVVDLPCEPHCLAHERWEPVETIGASPSEVTPLALLTCLGASEGEVNLDFDLLTHMRCVRCGAEESVMRPLQRSPAALVRCEPCEAETRRPETINRISADSVFANCPLAQLGVPAYQILSVTHNDRRRYVQLSGIYP